MAHESRPNDADRSRALRQTPGNGVRAPVDRRPKERRGLEVRPSRTAGQAAPPPPGGRAR